VILLVGPQETPFGIQKDFLCSKSAYFQKYFAERPPSLENVVPLPDTPVDVFAHAQHFLYTGAVVPSGHEVPNYEVLIGLWTLGYSLGIDGLCDAALECMIEYRRITQTIPATPLLVRVWNETPEGSSIRKLLLSWAAEYMRSSDSRAEFARSLPQELARGEPRTPAPAAATAATEYGRDGRRSSGDRISCVSCGTSFGGQRAGRH
jgi:hypothetical protein